YSSGGSSDFHWASRKISIRLVVQRQLGGLVTPFEAAFQRKRRSREWLASCPPRTLSFDRQLRPSGSQDAALDGQIAVGFTAGGDVYARVAGSFYADAACLLRAQDGTSTFLARPRFSVGFV